MKQMKIIIEDVQRIIEYRQKEAIKNNIIILLRGLQLQTENREEELNEFIGKN